MSMTRTANRHPPSVCSVRDFRFGATGQRRRANLARTVRDSLALFSSGAVQAGVLCALCLGVPDPVRLGPLAEAHSVTPRAELPAGRPGQRRQKGMKQFASTVEITLKQPVYSI